MQTNLFDYYLPNDRIAQQSVEPRDAAKLLVVDRTAQTFDDRHVFDLPDFLKPCDLLIFNNSKVFKARLFCHSCGVHPRREAGIHPNQKFELFLLRPTDDDRWLALAKPGKKLKMNDELSLEDGSRVTITDKKSDGTIVVDFHLSPDDVFALCDRLGEIPVPPYVMTQPDTIEKYQTIYAKERGSVAAPTAGFHFTPNLFDMLEKKGVKKAFVTLHVGLGTFRPMKTETLEEHAMHEEWYSLPNETVEAIEQTRQNGHRVIAVGTTTVRALESAFCSAGSICHSCEGRNPSEFGRIDSCSSRYCGNTTGMTNGDKSGFTSLFITPGYPFRVIDGLMTNFHLPKSTLLVLVSSFAGRELIMRAYQHAIDHDYRFYSFGDAMLIV